MAKGDRITWQALRKAFDGLPDRAKSTPLMESLAVGAGVLRVFLGDSWVEKHIMPEGKKGFLTIDESTSNRREETFFRVVDLSEVLYNLQHTAGFDECIDRMRDGDIEGTYAELDFGRMLFLNRIPFRYIVPQGVKKLDYDIEISYPDGRVACADAKCKVTTTDFAEKSVLNTLQEGRKQLPSDRPGIVFIKIPPRWMEVHDYDEKLANVARDFLRNTRRIVSVKYYVSPIEFIDGYLKHQHAYKEISNPHTNFGDMVDWNIFLKMDLPPEYNGMPPWWQRILFYPNGKER